MQHQAHQQPHRIDVFGAGITIGSQHVATNNAVLIAKLKLGYVIAGTEYVDAMGLLVRLVLHLTVERAVLFAARTGMLAP